MTDEQNQQDPQPTAVSVGVESKPSLDAAPLATLAPLQEAGGAATGESASGATVTASPDPDSSSSPSTFAGAKPDSASSTKSESAPAGAPTTGYLDHGTDECIEGKPAGGQHGPHHWLALAEEKLASLEHAVANEVRELIAAARRAL